MGDLTGKTALITGANTGIGRVTAKVLAARGAEVFLACRTESKARAVMDEIAAESPGSTTHFIALDLSSLASTRAAAAAFKEEDRPLHLLINNAGMAGRAPMSGDGFQWTFQVNHLGHFLLTQQLLERIPERGRVVNVASRAHYKANGIDWEALRQPLKSTTGLPEYRVSKLCNVLHAKALARRVADRGITTYSLHPGVVASDAWRQVPWPFRSVIKRFMITEEEGALTTLHCATSEEAGSETGLYYDSCAVKTPSHPARDEALAESLWERSEAWVHPT